MTAQPSNPPPRVPDAPTAPVADYGAALDTTSTFGLALSGGGFRATLFHLGVIHFLKKADLLHRVKHVCSVSGGSILATHLVLRWQAFVGNRPDDEASYTTAINDLLKFIGADVRMELLRRWLLSWLAWPSRRFSSRWRRTRIELLEDYF